MRPRELTRIIFLVLALALVVVVIRSLNSENAEKAFQTLGLSPGTPDSPGVEPGGHHVQAGDERFNFCKTRIRSLRWSSGRQVEEIQDGVKMKWLASDPKPREISYMDVERWLSQHCQIIVQPALPNQVAESSSGSIGDLVVRYVDGSETRYRRYAEGIYRNEQRAFRSNDLSEALKKLQEIAQFSPANGL